MTPEAISLRLLAFSISRLKSPYACAAMSSGQIVGKMDIQKQRQCTTLLQRGMDEVRDPRAGAGRAAAWEGGTEG